MKCFGLTNGHAGLSHDQQIMRLRRCVNPPGPRASPPAASWQSAPRCRKRGCTALKLWLATESTENTERNGEPLITGMNADRGTAETGFMWDTDERGLGLAENLR